MVERGRLPKLTSLRGQISFEYYFISNCSKSSLKKGFNKVGIFFPKKGDRAKYYAKSLWLFVKKILHIISTFHSVEKRKIHSHQQIFRQINSLVTSLMKTLLSRNFCQKSARVNFCNFHTVHRIIFQENPDCPWWYFLLTASSSIFSKRY